MFFYENEIFIDMVFFLSTFSVICCRQEAGRSDISCQKKCSRKRISERTYLFVLRKQHRKGRQEYEGLEALMEACLKE